MFSVRFNGRNIEVAPASSKVRASFGPDVRLADLKVGTIFRLGGREWVVIATSPDGVEVDLYFPEYRLFVKGDFESKIVLAGVDDDSCPDGWEDHGTFGSYEDARCYLVEVVREQ